MVARLEMTNRQAVETEGLAGFAVICHGHANTGAVTASIGDGGWKIEWRAVTGQLSSSGALILTLSRPTSGRCPERDLTLVLGNLHGQ